MQDVLERIVFDVASQHGTASFAALLKEGIDSQQILRLVEEGTIYADNDQISLVEPLIDIDPIVLINWYIPEGIIGGLTAMVYHHLSVAQLNALDVVVPQGMTTPPLIEWLAIHPIHLDAAKIQWGLTSIVPSLPGKIPVVIYTPAAALAQVLSQPYAIEDQLDTFHSYLATFGVDQNLQDACDVYGIVLGDWSVR